MVLEMKRALEDLKKGADGAYRKIYDATYEEVYCKSFLITQEEKQALSLVEDFYAGVLKEIGEALKAENQNLWFWQQYYKKIRREYQKLLSVQHKEAPGKAQNLAQILAALPLLHRVMLVMAYEDDFSAEQISAVLGLASEKIEGELEKLEKILPTLTQGQPQENAVWLAGWKTILAGADRQILGAVAADWVDVAYENAALNGIGRDRYTVRAGNVLTDGALVAELARQKYALVLANIVADVIIPMSARAGEFLDTDGVFLCSGIIDTRAGEVEAALERNGLAVFERREQNGWVALAARTAR